MTWADYAVFGVLGISALIGLARGFVREVLGIAAWVGALVVAGLFHGLAEPFVQRYVTDPAIAVPLAYGAVFLVALIVFTLIVGAVGGSVRRSILGGIDRTLGLLFGVVRGGVLLAALYLGAGLVIPPSRWPAPVLQAQSLPTIHALAAWIATLIPPIYRPKVPPLPKSGIPPASALMQSNPQGRATSPPPAPAAPKAP